MIQQANLNNIDVPIRLIITGKTNTGKSHYFLMMLYYLQDKLDELYIFSPTIYSNQRFIALTKQNHIHDHYDQDELNNILSSKEDQLRFNPNIKLPQCMIFFDDCIATMSKNDKQVSKLFMTGRHLNISVCIISQKFRAISPSIRDNTDFVICTRIINKLEQEAVYEEYNSSLT